MTVNRVTALFISLLLLLVAPIHAQQITDLLTVSVNAGYDGFFRANQWFPVRVTLENNGDAVSGRLVVRPETSGSGIPNTYSTPVDLPTGSTQAITLYITAYSSARDIRVELLGEDDRVVASEEVVIRNVGAYDQLYVVVSGTAGGSVINLSPVSVAGRAGSQANWQIANVPDRAAALRSIDVLLFNDVDTGDLSTAQRQAISDYVTTGGHLVVTGGAAWQETAAGLDTLLPFQPESGETSQDIDALLRFAGDYARSYDDQFIRANGDLTVDASVLAADDDGEPLVVRRTQGNGTVDYLAVDPNTQPLRNWDGIDGLWVSLLASVDTRPSWSFGFSNWQRALDAIEILPGLDLLPPILTLLGFLVAYIALVGPANYLILRRINRLDWAWITIPILIVVFTVVARGIGVNLRGNQATLSRVTVVQTWQDSDTAQVDQLIGLLAPRRGNYSLEVPDDRLLRPIPDLTLGTGVLSERTLGNVNIEETTTFEAVDFPLDAGFIASFTTTGTIDRPDIGGAATIRYDNTVQSYDSVQGAVRNNSDITLHNPVILAQGVAVPLGETLEPGAVEAFSTDGITYTGIDSPAPVPLEYVAGEGAPFLSNSTFFRSAAQAYSSVADVTAIDILGSSNYDTSGIVIDLNADPQTQENRRRQAFLNAFIIDQFASTGRGNSVYLAGWTDAAPLDEVVTGAGWDALDTTLYIVELALETDRTETAVIGQEQFVWLSRERTGTDDIVGPYSVTLYNQSEVVFRFTPLPEARLAEVEALTLILERPVNANPLIEFDVWNWRAATWDTVEFDREQTLTIDDPASYIGPLNAVEVRIRRPDTGSTVFLELVAIEQRGTF